MFPLVPYHALPKLHEAVKHDMPEPYRKPVGRVEGNHSRGAQAGERPGLSRQTRRSRRRPAANVEEDRSGFTTPSRNRRGWIEIVRRDRLGPADVIRFDHGERAYASSDRGGPNTTPRDGICTHGNTHLADGLVKGQHHRVPEAQRALPHRRRVAARAARLPRARHLSGGGPQRPAVPQRGRQAARCRGSLRSYQFRVVSNHNVATFIKELVLEPCWIRRKSRLRPGDYLQLEIPAYDEIRFRDFDIAEPYRTVWETNHVFDYVANNPEAGRPQLFAGQQSGG